MTEAYTGNNIINSIFWDNNSENDVASYDGMITAKNSIISKYRVNSLRFLGDTFSGWVNKDLVTQKDAAQCEQSLRDLANSMIFGISSSFIPFNHNGARIISAFFDIYLHIQ